MDKLEENYTNRLWNTKHITAPDEDWFICKFFKTKKQQLPMQEQLEVIESKKKYFWEYMPITVLCETHDWEYYIKQRYIKWKTLAETDISTLSSETLAKLIDLINRYIKYHNEQHWDMDITWYQYYEWNPWTIERKLRNFLKINQNFLTSTNIMISDDWEVYMVDVCESNDSRILWKIKNFCARPFIRRTIFQLEQILQQKVQFENKSKEIFDVLDM